MVIIAKVITRSDCPSCPKTLQAPGHPGTLVSVGDHGPRHDSLGQAYRGDSPVPTNQIINSTKTSTQLIYVSAARTQEGTHLYKLLIFLHHSMSMSAKARKSRTRPHECTLSVLACNQLLVRVLRLIHVHGDVRDMPKLLRDCGQDLTAEVRRNLQTPTSTFDFKYDAKAFVNA